jgi:hypothetical protein
MAGSKQIPQPWRSFLGELDQHATEETRLDCMGIVCQPAKRINGWSDCHLAGISDLDLCPAHRTAPLPSRTNEFATRAVPGEIAGFRRLLLINALPVHVQSLLKGRSADVRFRDYTAGLGFK